MAQTSFDRRVEAVRHFNRFYTKRIGVLSEGLLDSAFSLAEARVLYELASRDGLSATEIGRGLDLDPGYLSRILRGFAKRRLVRMEPDEADRRRRRLRLTKQGRAALAPLETRSQSAIGAMLRKLPASEQERLVDALRAVEVSLDGAKARPNSYVLRTHRAGDVGWIVHRHGVVYASEYGWDERFEALVAEIVAQFIQKFQPQRERCWIAEVDGVRAGSIMLVEQSKTVAKLRLLLVEPEARGLGIGAKLVDECVRFARQARYRKVTLWTQSILVAARHLYENAGFRLIQTERHCSFGYDLVGETWELAL